MSVGFRRTASEMRSPAGDPTGYRIRGAVKRGEAVVVEVGDKLVIQTT